MRPIKLSGPYLWGWGVWHLAWIAGLLWISWAAAPRLVMLYFAILYTVFLPLELSGVALNHKRKDGVARTLSEIRQYIPDTFGRGRANVGWRAFGYTGVLDALIVGWLVYQVHPWLGASLSILLAIWLVPHFGWRERVG